MSKNCIFCQIVRGEIPSFQVWEDEQHLAFLTIFPNTDGVTVVITKEHKPSYIFDNDKQTVDTLMAAAKTVAQKIDRAFDDVGRTGVIFEGFGVDHLHAKLYPMHGTAHTVENWENIESAKPTEFFRSYPGYLSSHDAQQEDSDTLSMIAKMIKNS